MEHRIAADIRVTNRLNWLYFFLSEGARLPVPSVYDKSITIDVDLDSSVLGVRIVTDFDPVDEIPIVLNEAIFKLSSLCGLLEHCVFLLA